MTTIQETTWVFDRGTETVAQAGDLWDAQTNTWAEHVAMVEQVVAAGAALIVTCARTVTVPDGVTATRLDDLFDGEMATNEEGFGGDATAAAGERVDVWEVAR